MNREIKFRTWDKEAKEMYDCKKPIKVLVSMDNKTYAMVGDIKGTIGKIERESTLLMQYTGLKDKNGNEIYEGDIISDFINGSLGEVFFDEGCYLVDWEDEFTVITLHQNIREFDVVVVGNIYENPELLECDEKWVINLKKL